MFINIYTLVYKVSWCLLWWLNKTSTS